MASAAIEELEEPKAKTGRYLLKFDRLDTTGYTLNHPSVTMSRVKEIPTHHQKICNEKR